MRAFNIPLHLSIANSLYTQTALNGGVSINSNFEEPQTGYLVSIKDGLVFDNVSAVNVHELSAWIKDNLNETKDTYFGGWKDSESGKVYFDLSVNVFDQKKAIDLGNAKDQIAIWDVANQTEIRIK